MIAQALATLAASLALAAANKALPPGPAALVPAAPMAPLSPVITGPFAAGMAPVSIAPQAQAQVPALPPFLVSADPAHAPWLAGVVAKAQESKTARRVLRQAEQLTRQTGRPIVVAVGEKGEWASLDFDTDVLWMRRLDLALPSASGAVALAHELRHAVQKGKGLPDVFELELDAYMVDFQTAVELDDVEDVGSYDARARKAFKRGPEAFVKFLRRYYKADPALHGRVREHRKDLRADLEAEVANRQKLAALLHRRMKVLHAMEQSRYPAELVENYRVDTIAPIQRKLSAAERLIGWYRRDLEILADPARRRRAAAFARRTVKRLERLSRELELP